MRQVIQVGRVHRLAGLVLVGILVAGNCVSAGAVTDQFSWNDLKHPKQKAVEMAFCNANSPLAKELSQKVAMLANAGTKAGISVQAQQRQFEIGVAMALCHGGFHVASTLYSHLSQRDQDARQKALDDAVAHESKDTTTYVLPDHPDITGTITPVSTTVAENGKQCAVFQDSVAEASQNDSALNKFCRTPPATDWQRQTAI